MTRDKLLFILIWIIYCSILGVTIYIRSKFSKHLIKRVSSLQFWFTLIFPPNLLRLFIIYKKRKAKKKKLKIIKGIIT